MKKEWIEDYLKKSGDVSLLKGNLEENDNGFLIWRDVDGVFVLLHVYGDGALWEEWILSKAKELGCSKVRYATKRNPETIIKRYGGKIVSYLIERDIG